MNVTVEIRDFAAYVHGGKKARCGRSSGVHLRQGGADAVRRHRQPGGRVYDGEARPFAGLRAFRQPALYQRARPHEGADAGQKAHALYRQPERICSALHRRAGAYPRQRSRGPVHGADAPQHDAHHQGSVRKKRARTPLSRARAWPRWPARR